MIRRGIGVQSYVSAGGGTDADAQAFITAAGITDATQQTAINTLVTDLKGYGIWTKMKAIYPFVGGTSSTHKWNLKDPADTDAAFRLVFSGGGTHSSTGYQPNGTNGYGDTKLNNNTISQNSGHISIYVRNNTTGLFTDIGADDLTNSCTSIWSRYNDLTYNQMHNQSGNYLTYSNSNSQGYYISNRVASNNLSAWKNGTKNATATTLSRTPSNRLIFIGALNDNGTANFYSNRNYAFASIGDGLTDTEAANLYTAVQAYQTTLGRSVGTQTVSDSDAQAFVNAAVIEDQVQATAINTLVTDLKGYGIWSKMKAIWPFVGGTSSTHKWNLKDPRDLDAAFRLVFSGGWTHSSTGALPNGTNAYADTFLNGSTQLSTPSHLSKYTTTNTNKGTDEIDMGIQNFWLSLWYNGSGFNNLLARNQSGAVLLDGGIVTDARGFVITTKISNTAKIFKNNAQLDSKTDTTNTYTNNTIYLGAGNFSGVSLYSSRNFCFASIGDGLTDTEAANFYTAVQAYQTSLNRQV